jgi:hypothetical protein
MCYSDGFLFELQVSILISMKAILLCLLILDDLPIKSNCLAELHSALRTLHSKPTQSLGRGADFTQTRMPTRNEDVRHRPFHTYHAFFDFGR